MDAQPSLAEAAREYATARGWAVFPCQPRGKTPATEHGCLDASSDPETIAAAWGKRPNYNIGIATGPKSRIFVLDEDGEGAIAALEAKHGPLPPTLTQTTSRGRRHLFFRYPAGVEIHNSASKIGENVDIRGLGGYVIVAPSVHPSGAVYRWSNDLPIADAPAWLIELIRPAQPNNGNDGAEHGGEFAEGQRNDALFRLARSLKLKALSQAAVLAAVLAENRTKCRPPLPDAEVAAIVANSFKQPDREGFEVRDVTALRTAIRGVVLAAKVPLFDKRRGVFGLIRDALLSDGFLCRTADGRLLYFSKVDRRLYDLASADFSFLLTAETGLSAIEKFFGFALNLLQSQTARLTPVPVHTLGHYDPATGVLAVSDAGPGIWVRERGGEWMRSHNGENGLLFFTEPSATPWEPNFGDHHLGWFLDNFTFADNPPLTAADAKLLFTILLLQQFFPRLRRTRLLPAFLGPMGSGKTTKIRLIGRLLLGPDFDVTNLRKEKEDAFVAAITNSIVVGVDNADSRIDWLEDALATYATGLKYQLRQLYTTNEQATFWPRAFLMLSSRDAHFRRPDVAERLLPLHCKRYETFLDEPELWDQLDKRRGAIWGDLLCLLGQAADAQQQCAPRLKFRMADFSAFGWKLLKTQGREAAWPTVLEHVAKAQLMFAGEDDGLIETLRVVLAAGPVNKIESGELFKSCATVAKDQGFSFPRTAGGFGQKLTSMARVIESEIDVKFIDDRGHARKRSITLEPRGGATS